MFTGGLLTGAIIGIVGVTCGQLKVPFWVAGLCGFAISIGGQAITEWVVGAF
jgi:hypothetical protein